MYREKYGYPALDQNDQNFSLKHSEYNNEQNRYRMKPIKLTYNPLIYDVKSKKSVFIWLYDNILFYFIFHKKLCVLFEKFNSKALLWY